MSQKNFDDYDMQFTKKVISECAQILSAEWKPVCLSPHRFVGHVHFIELIMPALVAGAKKSARSRKPKESETLGES